ncbi:MAG TPA: hypothetical protein PLX89_24260 [Verrucomicrobiota bacterium]|nr:hypothetical protein [Verrucomicrobiales bacterium]HRI16125.1 hypothetical protein [Verrucomicrobiota bacterium]
MLGPVRGKFAKLGAPPDLRKAIWWGSGSFTQVVAEAGASLRIHWVRDFDHQPLFDGAFKLPI